MSNENIERGAKTMEKEFIRAFSIAGKTIENFKWSPDFPEYPSLFSHYTVEIKSDSSLYTLENIPREVLDDYPGKVGSEVIDFYISKLVSISHIDLNKAHNGNFIL